MAKKRKYKPQQPVALPPEKPRAISEAARFNAARKPLFAADSITITRDMTFEPYKPAPGVLPLGIAMDSCVPSTFMSGALTQWAAQSMFHEGLAFLGYPYLAELAQRSEYRRPAEIWADHATRKWIKIRGPEEKVKQLEKFMGENDEGDDAEETDSGINVRSTFRTALEKEGMFGRCQIFLDFDDADDFPELATPLTVSATKINQKRPLKRLKVVEPMWSYPAPYNSTNPLAADFYVPNAWYVYGNTVSDTRMLTLVSREVPDMLKPAYAFGGLSLTQMMKPYVDIWLGMRQSVGDLAQAFSQMVLKTDTSSLMIDGGDLFTRVDTFNDTRSNRGTMVIGESEELTNVTTSLSGLDKLLAQSQEHQAAPAGIPLIIMFGITPSGLNASSEGEILIFQDNVKTYQEKVVEPRLTPLFNICQLSLWGKIDPAISYEFPHLSELTQEQQAKIRESNAKAHGAYVTMGAVDNEEVRETLSNEEGGLYHGVDLSGPAPEPETEPAPVVAKPARKTK